MPIGRHSELCFISLFQVKLLSLFIELGALAREQSLHSKSSLEPDHVWLSPICN